MLSDLAILIEVVARVIYDLIVYGLCLALFAAILLFFGGYLVYAIACWRCRP